jgi:hypothetical protein
MLLLCFDFASFLSCCRGVCVCVCVRHTHAHTHKYTRTHAQTHHGSNNSVIEHSKINIIVVLAEEILVFSP